MAFIAANGTIPAFRQMGQMLMSAQWIFGCWGSALNTRPTRWALILCDSPEMSNLFIFLTARKSQIIRTERGREIAAGNCRSFLSLSRNYFHFFLRPPPLRIRTHPHVDLMSFPLILAFNGGPKWRKWRHRRLFRMILRKTFNRHLNDVKLKSESALKSMEYLTGSADPTHFFVSRWGAAPNDRNGRRSLIFLLFVLFRSLNNEWASQCVGWTLRMMRILWLGVVHAHATQLVRLVVCGWFNVICTLLAWRINWQLPDSTPRLKSLLK